MALPVHCVILITMSASLKINVPVIAILMKLLFKILSVINATIIWNNVFNALTNKIVSPAAIVFIHLISFFNK